MTTTAEDSNDMATHTPLRHLGLCSGYGGMSLGFRLAGANVRTVAHVERDSHAAAVLVARMEDEVLDQAPIWDDLTTFDGSAWSGRVDIISAGFPCQPWSSAGARKGIDDDRWLWPPIAGIIRDVGPRYVFLENAPGLNRRVGGGGLSFVLQDLADLGLDAEWGNLSAAAVGASHKRERIWILAYAAGVDEREPNDQARTVAWQNARQDTGGRSSFPPSPDDSDGWDDYLAAGGPEPSVRRSVDGGAGRLVKPEGLADRLHLLGNGLVPRVAASAFTQLLERAETT